MMPRLDHARYETRRDGYERWRSFEDGRERYVYVHRLAAVAWDILDGLDDDRHVHYALGVEWATLEDEIEARDPVRHGDHHLNGGALS